MKTLHAVLALTMSAPAPLVGQARTESLAVDARLLRTKTDSLAVFLIRGEDTIRTGTVVDELRSNESQLVRVYSTTDRVLGDRLDTIVSSFKDLRPVAYRTISASQIARISFEGRSVSGWLRLPNGDSTTVYTELPDVVYDATTFDLLARASPLADGFTLTVPSFLIGPNTVTALTGSVAGSEPVDGRACWVFKANFAGMPVTFWIDKETRDLRQQLMQFRADMAVLFRRARGVPIGERAT